MTNKEVEKKTTNSEAISAEKEKKEVEFLDLKLSSQEEFLAYLKRNEKLSQEMLRSLKFIRKYYFWRSLFNGFKIAIVIIVIILGIVTWDNIVGFFTSGNIERGFTDAIRNGLGNSFNF